MCYAQAGSIFKTLYHLDVMPLKMNKAPFIRKKSPQLYDHEDHNTSGNLATMTWPLALSSPQRSRLCSMY
jgi:hypothetical protein